MTTSMTGGALCKFTTTIMRTLVLLLAVGVPAVVVEAQELAPKRRANHRCETRSGYGTSDNMYTAYNLGSAVLEVWIDKCFSTFPETPACSHVTELWKPEMRTIAEKMSRDYDMWSNGDDPVIIGSPLSNDRLTANGCATHCVDTDGKVRDDLKKDGSWCPMSPEFRERFHYGASVESEVCCKDADDCCGYDTSLPKLSDGAIAGIVIGILVAVGGGILACYFGKSCCFSHRRNVQTPVVGPAVAMTQQALPVPMAGQPMMGQPMMGQPMMFTGQPIQPAYAAVATATPIPGQQQASPPAVPAGRPPLSDEDLARQLQAQLDLEDLEVHQTAGASGQSVLSTVQHHQTIGYAAGVAVTPPPSTEPAAPPIVPTQTSVTSVTTIEGFLDAARVDKERFLAPLQSLGVSSVDDLKDVTDGDLDDMGMSALVKRRFLAEVANL